MQLSWSPCSCRWWRRFVSWIIVLSAHKFRHDLFQRICAFLKFHRLPQMFHVLDCFLFLILYIKQESIWYRSNFQRIFYWRSSTFREFLTCNCSSIHHLINIVFQSFNLLLPLFFGTTYADVRRAYSILWWWRNQSFSSNFTKVSFHICKIWTSW